MNLFLDQPSGIFADEPQLADFTRGTVAWIIQRFIDETDSLKKIGPTQMYVLRALQKSKIGQKVATKLTRGDIIEHCRERRKTVCPATVNQDVTFLRGALDYAGSAWDDCENVSSLAITAAKPLLNKFQLVGKSKPRTRRPTDDELHALLDHFAKQNEHPRTVIDMCQVVAFALASSRRISEICRITWGDVDFERGVYKVRDLKHPTRKKGNDKEFALLDPMPEIIRRQPRRNPANDDERIFPYNAKCCSQRYTDAKKILGIKDLHFHDNRREAITRWLKKLPPHKVRQISGHENTIILERVYDAPRAEDLNAEVAALGRSS